MFITALLLITPIYAAINPSAFTLAARFEGVPPELLRGICWVESGHSVDAYREHDGGSPSHGLCQIKLATARLLGFKGSADKLQRPAINLRYAAKYLRKQLDRYNGDWIKAIIAYNRGTYREDLRAMEYLRKVLNAIKEGK